MPFKVITQSGFLRGINAATGKTVVVPGTIIRDSNMFYTRRGSLSTVDGTKIIAQNGDWNSTQGTLSDSQIVAIEAVAYGATGRIPIAVGVSSEILGGLLGQSHFFAYDLSTPNAVETNFHWGNSSFPQGPNNFRLPQLISVNGVVVLCPGNDAPPSYTDFYNNTTPSVQLGRGNGQIVPGAAHGILHANRVWLWNTSPTDTAFDGPSVLRMCNATPDQTRPDLVNGFSDINVAWIDSDDGTQGQGIIDFTSAEAGIAPTSTVILFKDFATYQVTGLLAPQGGFSVTRAQTDLGCAAPRSIQFAPGFGIVRLTHLGVAVFDGAKDTIISEEIHPYLFPEEPDLTTIDWTRAKYASSTISANPPLYCLAIPVQGSLGLTRIFIYDLVLKAWGIVDLPAADNPDGDVQNIGPISCLGTLRMPGMEPETCMADLNDETTSSGHSAVRRWLQDDPDWDGIPISWSFKTPEIFSGNPTTRLYVRRSVLRAKSYSSPITASFEVSGVEKTTQAVQQMQYLGAHAFYGSGHYGVSLYSGGVPDLISPFDVGITGMSANVRYSGTGRIEVLANDWHLVEKPAGAFGRAS